MGFRNRKKQRKETSSELYMMGIASILMGLIFCITIIGFIPGMIFVIIGVLSIVKGGKIQQKEKAEQQALEAENVEKTRKAIADGIAEGLRKAREAESTIVAVSKDKVGK